MKLNQNINTTAITATETTKTETNNIISFMTPDGFYSAIIFETMKHSTPIATIYLQKQTHQFTLPWITMANNMTTNSYLTSLSDYSHTTVNNPINIVDNVLDIRKQQQSYHHHHHHYYHYQQSLSPSTMAFYTAAVSLSSPPSSSSPSSSSSSPSTSSSSSSSSTLSSTSASSSSSTSSLSSATINYSSTSPYSLSYSPYFTSSPIVSNAYNYDDESEKELFQQYLRNQALETPILVTLIIVYAVLIFIGAFGNGLVCLAVARNPRMRTPQNLFIVNLAISDLLLCFFTIPFSLFEIATKFWPYGVTMCKLVQALEGTSIFVSTLSIIAIALDRYNVILRSVSPDQHRRTTVVPIFLKLILIWIIGIILSMPLFLVRTVESHYIGMGPINTINFCIEKWPIENGRAYYSVLSMLIQYVGPIIIVSVVYARLCIKLRSRTLRRTSTTQLPKLRTRLQRRTRKTNLLLISIALIFFISWLPLNVLNIVADFFFPVSAFRITFAICHMFGMSSACSNPFLYGWLNQTFRNEFKEIFNSFQRLFCHHCYKNPTMQRHQLTSVIRESDHSMSFSPNHRIIHYQPSNGRCTITDFSHINNTRTNPINNNNNNNNNINNTNIVNNNMIITKEDNDRKNPFLTNDNNNNIYHRLNFNPSIATTTTTTNLNETTDTTQIYQTNKHENESNGFQKQKQQSIQKKQSDGQIRINYPIKLDNENQYQNTNTNNNNQINFNRNAHCKFKRLSLVDSRKCRRKRNSIDQTSPSPSSLTLQLQQKHQQQINQQNSTFKNRDKNRIENYHNELKYYDRKKNINKNNNDDNDTGGGGGNNGGDSRHSHQNQQQQHKK